MSISVETAKEHLNDPAVLCCRREKGKLLEASDLEDPTLFPDYEDSGLLELPDNVLTIGQVLGATLDKTMDALLPLTPDVVDNIQDPSAQNDDEEDKDDDTTESDESSTTSSDVTTTVANNGVSDGMLRGWEKTNSLPASNKKIRTVIFSFMKLQFGFFLFSINLTPQ